MVTVMDRVIFVFWIVCFFHMITGEDICPIDSLDCTQEGVPCTILRDPDCSYVVDDTSSPPSSFPGPVTNFTVRPYYLQPEVAASRSRVEISWSLPQNGSHRHVAGFEVRLTQGNGLPYCFIFKLNSSSATWQPDVQYTYILNCTTVHTSGYSIAVTSLPKAPFSDMMASALLKIAQKKRDEDSDCYRDIPQQRLCWDTDIVIYNLQCSRTVRVVYQQAPVDLDFTGYTVSLIENNVLTPDESITISKVENSGYGEAEINTSQLQLPLPNRTILVSPDSSHCTGNRCRNTKSQLFNIREGKEKECTFIPPTPPEEMSDLTNAALIGIIVGTVVFVAIITAIIAVIAKNRKQEKKPTLSTNAFENGVDTRSFFSVESNRPLVKVPTGLTFVSENNQQSGKARTKRKLAYLMYSNDSPHHQDVVGCFAAFLNRICCDVIYDRLNESDGQIRQNKTLWIQKSMTHCDFILIINSEGAFWKSRAHQTGEGFLYPKYDTQTHCIGDMFTPALDILQDDFQLDNPGLLPKVIMTHFEYTSSDKMCVPIPQLQVKANYKLMHHIDDLIMHIDPTLTENTSLEDFGDIRESDVLQRALERAVAFTTNNANWFEKYNGFPLSQSTAPVPVSSNVPQATQELIVFPNPHHNDVTYDLNLLGHPSPPSKEWGAHPESSYITDSRLRSYQISKCMKQPIAPDDITTLNDSTMENEIMDINDSDPVDSGYSNISSTENICSKPTSGNVSNA